MNRREMLAGLTAALATAGVEGEAQAVGGEPAPLLLVLRHPGRLTYEAQARIRESLAAEFGRLGKDCPPIVMIEEGMTIEAVERLMPTADDFRRLTHALEEFNRGRLTEFIT